MIVLTERNTTMEWIDTLRAPREYFSLMIAGEAARTLVDRAAPADLQEWQDGIGIGPMTPKEDRLGRVVDALRRALMNAKGGYFLVRHRKTPIGVIGVNPDGRLWSFWAKIPFAAARDIRASFRLALSVLFRHYGVNKFSNYILRSNKFFVSAINALPSWDARCTSLDAKSPYLFFEIPRNVC